MKKCSLMLFICTCFILSFLGCTTKYRAENFIGKTSAEIISQYDSFDCIGMPSNEDGLYRNCQCGYTITEPQVGFLGTSPERLFFITFDENGIAIKCEEGYRPGG